MNKLNEKPGITAQDVLERINYNGIADLIPQKEYDFVDFFCGAGGMSYGFHRMAELTGRFRWAGAIDIDKHAIDTYEHNYGHRPANINLGDADIEVIKGKNKYIVSGNTYEVINNKVVVKINKNDKASVTNFFMFVIPPI